MYIIKTKQFFLYLLRKRIIEKKIVLNHIVTFLLNFYM